ncbi:MAG: hypothetical protein RMJ31_05470, partial [Nitrososphaerota archaeon]|nr:hypothetical protein [Nitrososphaerota archaeon]
MNKISKLISIIIAIWSFSYVFVSVEIYTFYFIHLGLLLMLIPLMYPLGKGSKRIIDYVLS